MASQEKDGGADIQEDGDGNKDNENTPMIDSDKDGGTDKDTNKKKDSQYFPFENNGKPSKAREENFFWSLCLCTCPAISIL